MVEVFVGEGFAAPFPDVADAPVVAAEHQEQRRIQDPRHFREMRDDAPAFGGVGDMNDVGLLQIAFGRCRQRAGAEQPQQVRTDRIRAIAAQRPVFGDTRQFGDAGLFWRHGEGFTVAGIAGGCDAIRRAFFRFIHNILFKNNWLCYFPAIPAVSRVFALIVIKRCFKR